jgi:peroxiredoxin Q/BCP
MLATGDTAPYFELPDSDMNIRTLAEFSGSYLVMYFYPKDDTPGCTIQANEFTDLIDDYDAAGVQVVGISADDCFSHQAFRQKFGLKIILLADVDKEVCEQYGVIQEKEKDGVRKVGIVRSSFIIDPAGRLAYAEYGVTPRDHARRMLDLARQLAAERA